MPPFSTISSHVPFRLDRSIRRLHAHRRKSQVRRNLVNQRKERIVRFASLSSPLPFHICSSAKDGQNAKINVLILTHLHVRFSRPVLPKFPSALFFFHARSAKWATGGMENGEEGGVRKYTCTSKSKTS